MSRKDKERQIKWNKFRTDLYREWQTKYPGLKQQTYISFETAKKIGLTLKKGDTREQDNKTFNQYYHRPSHIGRCIREHWYTDKAKKNQRKQKAKQKKQNTSSISRKDPNQSSNQSSNPGYDWASATASSDLFQTSPKVQAHINEARQRRTQWELKDPAELPEKSTEFVQNVKKDRFHRNASAPFATEQSLKIKLESSAGLQQTLMNLGLERTQLEADIIRLEPKSRKKMDARLQKERMEIRLGVISKNSMTIKKKLREMGM